MSEPKYDVVALGNALVDVISRVDDSYVTSLEKNYGIVKGTMSLIDEARAVELYLEMEGKTETSGGSAANTMAGFASFGGRGAFIGKVGEDKLGETFRNDIKGIGVTFESTPLVVGPPTGRCLVMVTPDGDRTMNTFLGASVEFSTDDIDANLIGSSKITYLEGYLYDKPQAKKAFQRGAEIAHDAGHKVALTLSDPFCVDRHREDFRFLVDSHVDILFANEQEVLSLCEVDSFEQAAKLIAQKCDVAVLTRGEKGSVISSQGDIVEIDAVEIDEVIDTTGAGDQYAAGFLYGYTQGMAMEACGRLGALAATEVISHIGPRPEKPYRDFLDVLKHNSEVKFA